MNIRFDNKKALVTGGTRGIGKAISEEFQNNGAKVVVTGTSVTKPKDVHEGITYESLVIDKDADWHRRIDEIVEKYDGFDICINNAGINRVNKIYETQKNDIDDILLTNLNAPLYITSVISKKMIQNKYGYIVNIASIFGVVSKTGRNPYTASKSGLIGVTKTMAIDLGEYNILVNSVSPGFVNTELTRRVLGKEGMKEMRLNIPLKKLAQVSDIVPIVLFLSSDLNTYITGQNIVVDGGFTIE